MVKDIVDLLNLKFRRFSERWRAYNKWERMLRMQKITVPLALYIALIFARQGWTAEFTANPFSLLVFMFQTGFPVAAFLTVLFFIELPLLIVTMYRDKIGIPDPNRDFSVSKHGTYGTAEQLTEAQVKEWGGAKVLPVEDTIGPIFGQFDTEGKKVVSFNLEDSSAMMNRHILVFGASMSGKTFSFVLPHLLQMCKRGESVVMSDPKGELFSETSEYFRKHGYIVRVLNFNEFQYSDGWDILSELGDASDVAKVQERAQIFAETVIANTMSNTEDMFRSAPLSLLKAVMLRVYLDPTLEHTFSAVYAMISNPGGKDFFDSVFDENELKGPLKCCLGPYSTYRQQSANLAGNTLSGLANAIQVFQTDRVRSLTSTPGIDLSLPGKRKCAYYLIFPDQHETYRFLTSLFFSFLFIDLVAYADGRPSRHCEVPVNCLFEEAKSVGYVPGFATKLSNIRSRHVYITSIWQDLAQVQYLYPDEWSSILNNSSTQLCLGFNDLDTAKLFSDRSGAATIMVDTERHGAFETDLNLFHAHNVGEGNRTVFNPDELLRADKNDCFVIFQRMNVLKCHKFPVTLHPAFSEMKETSKAITGEPVQPKDVIPPIPDIPSDDGTLAEKDAELALIAAQKKAKEEYEEKIFREADEYEAWINSGNKEKFGGEEESPEHRTNAYDIDVDKDNVIDIFRKNWQKRQIDKKATKLPTSDDLGVEGKDWNWEVDIGETLAAREASANENRQTQRKLPSKAFVDEMKRVREEQDFSDTDYVHEQSDDPTDDLLSQDGMVSSDNNLDEFDPFGHEDIQDENTDRLIQEKPVDYFEDDNSVVNSVEANSGGAEKFNPPSTPPQSPQPPQEPSKEKPKRTPHEATAAHRGDQRTSRGKSGSNMMSKQARADSDKQNRSRRTHKNKPTQGKRMGNLFGGDDNSL